MSSVASASVSVPRLYEDIPNLNQQAIMSAIATGRGISNSILMAYLQGPITSLNAMRRYSNGPNYTAGPTTVETSVTSDGEAWLDYLEATYPYSPQGGFIEYYVITASTSAAIGSKGNATYIENKALQDNPIVSPDTYHSSSNSGAAITVNKLVNGTGSPVVHLTVNTPVLTNVNHYVTYDLFEQAVEYGQDKTPVYLDTFVDIYDEGTNQIPALHGSGTQAPAIDDELFPIVPIRKNGVDYEKDGSGLPESTSIRQILRRMHLDPEDIVESIKSNPDEALIDDVYVGTGISISQTEEWGVAALAETFQLLFERNPNSQTNYNSTGKSQNIEFQVDGINGLNNTISFDYITSEIVPTGQVVTEYSKAVLGTNQYSFTMPFDDNNFRLVNVFNLRSVHIVAVPAVGTKEVKFEGNEDELVIPLFSSILQRVPHRLKSDIAFGSMILYIYAYDVQSLSWYETSIFKTLLIVVAIVVAVVTYGGSLSTTFATQGTAAGLSALAGIIATIVITDIAVQWLVEEVGGTLGIILAIAASVALSGNVDFSSLSTALSTGWYALYTATIRVYGEYQSNQFDTLTDQQEAFAEDYETRLEELDAARDALQYGESLELLDIIEYRSLPNTTINEEPQQFYNRTSTTIDIASISNNLVTDYYEIQTQLPMVDSYLPTHEFTLGV